MSRLWPRRSPTTPAGRPRRSKWAQRKLEKVEVDRRAKLADLEVKERDLDVQRKVDAYDDEKAKRADNRKASKETAERDGRAAALRRVGDWFCEHAALIAVLLFVGVCTVAEIAGQFMSYSELSWPPAFAWLRYIIPWVVVAGSWANAIIAWRLIHRRKPHARYTRRMWAFAVLAAIINGYHGAVVLNDTSMAWVLGGSSVLGPFLWHGYLHMTRVIVSGRSAEEVLAGLLRLLYHPWLCRRARGMWAASDRRVSLERAFLIEYRRARGCFPGETPADELVPARNAWLFKLIFGRVVNPALTVTVEVSKQDTQPSAAGTADTDTEPAEQRAEKRSQPDAAGPANIAGLALVGGSGGDDFDDIVADLEAWERDIEKRVEAATQQRSDSGTDIGGSRRPDPTSGEPGKRSGSGPRPTTKSARRKRGKAAGADKRKAVEDWFDKRVEEGVKPEDMNAAEAARQTGVSMPYARAVIARKRKRGATP